MLTGASEVRTDMAGWHEDGRDSPTFTRSLTTVSEASQGKGQSDHRALMSTTSSKSVRMDRASSEERNDQIGIGGNGREVEIDPASEFGVQPQLT